MLNERRKAVERVTAAFIAAEKATDQAAALSARCIATMIEQRAGANLPIDTGGDAFALFIDATFQALDTRAKLIAVHDMLRPLPTQLGVHAYGGDNCPPNEPFTTAASPLHAVA